IITADFVTAMSLSLWVHLILIFVSIICIFEIYYSEKHGLAIISEESNELIIEQVFLFGIFKVKISYDITDEFRSFLNQLTKQNIEKFDIPKFHETITFNITFYRIHLNE